MAKPIYLNNLKNEIDSRKKEKNLVSSRLGEGTSGESAPRDTFLYSLLESLKTGRETPASTLIKTVDNKTSQKLGEKTKFVISERTEVPPSTKTSTSTLPLVREGSGLDASVERDELMFAELEKKRRETLADAMAEAMHKPKQSSQQLIAGTQSQQTIDNEGYLVENVKKIVNNYLVENFGVVVEEAIKDTIIEMYAIERIKIVLQENKELIKGVVIDVIKEIQAKNKSKAQS